MAVCRSQPMFLVPLSERRKEEGYQYIWPMLQTTKAMVGRWLLTFFAAGFKFSRVSYSQNVQNKCGLELKMSYIPI